MMTTTSPVDFEAELLRARLDAERLRGDGLVERARIIADAVRDGERLAAELRSQAEAIVARAELTAEAWLAEADEEQERILAEAIDRAAAAYDAAEATAQAWLVEADEERDGIVGPARAEADTLVARANEEAEEARAALDVLVARTDAAAAETRLRAEAVLLEAEQRAAQADEERDRMLEVVERLAEALDAERARLLGAAHEEAARVVAEAEAVVVDAKAEADELRARAAASADADSERIRAEAVEAAATTLREAEASARRVVEEAARDAALVRSELAVTSMRRLSDADQVLDDARARVRTGTAVGRVDDEADEARRMAQAELAGAREAVEHLRGGRPTQDAPLANGRAPNGRGPAGPVDGGEPVVAQSALPLRRQQSWVAGRAAAVVIVAGLVALVVFAALSLPGSSEEEGPTATTVADERPIPSPVEESDSGAYRSARLASGSATFVVASDDGDIELGTVVTDGGVGYLAAERLPMLGRGRTYQLWQDTGRALVPLGVLGADPGVVTFEVSGRLDGLVVSDEPVPGVPELTTDPVVAGSLAG